MATHAERDTQAVPPLNTLGKKTTGSLPFGLLSKAGALRSSGSSINSTTPTGPVFPRVGIATCGGSGKQPEYTVPIRKIFSKSDLERFDESAYHAEILEFLQRLQESVVDVRVTDVVRELEECPEKVSPTVRNVRALLETAEAWVDEYPAIGTSSRFGNPAFRDWCKRLAREVRVSSGLDEKEKEELKGEGEGADAKTGNDGTLLWFVPKEARVELGGYLSASFGSAKRIDYGTGHELSFLVFLLSLYKMGLLGEEDHRNIAILLIWRYIGTMRKLQFTYWLEPAGSQGVWGLDDYHFLPFLLGAAQLREHKYLKPKSIHSNDVIAEYSKDYMYLSCIEFVNSVKTASLRWHSPMLDDVSGVKSWGKVADGMLKMYKAEVLGKLPIMQHFLFGGLIDFKASISDEQLELLTKAALAGDDIPGADDGDDCCSYHHGHSAGIDKTPGSIVTGVFPGVEREYPTCCGIRIPSAMGAAAAAREASSSSAGIPRPIPFD